MGALPYGEVYPTVDPRKRDGIRGFRRDRRYDTAVAIQETERIDTAPPLTRPRRSSRRVRRRRTILIVVAAVAVALIVAAVIIVPPIVSRAAAVSRYDAAAGQVAELRTQLDDAYTASGGTGSPAASLDQADAMIAAGSPLITADAAAAFQTALDDASAQLGGDQSSILTRPALDTDTATIAELDAESAILEGGLDSLKASVADAPDKVAAAAQSIATGWDGLRTAVMTQGMNLLDAYADAEKPTEDALYQALTAFQEAPADQAAAALAAATTASDAVKANAQAYRDQITAAAAGKSTQPAGGSVDAQLEYLQTYWQTYNLAEWGNYNPLGGDCVNFTSQGLIHRGWQMDDQWKSPGANGMASKPWISTTAMEAYLKGQGFVSNDNDHLDRVRPGDVGIFDWGEKGPGVDHTMTVSKVEYTADGPIVYFVSHNSDGDYRELQYTLFTQHQNSKVRIYSIP